MTMRRLLIILSLITLALVVVAALLAVLLPRTSEKEISRSQLKPPPLRSLRPLDGGQPIYIIPSSRIPRTMAERAEAAPITLTPDHWEAAAQRIANAPLPYNERRKLVAATRAFLSRWETFIPPDRAAEVLATRRRYRLKIAPWVYPANLDPIAARVDSQAPSLVCPQDGCSVGSRWIDQKDLAERLRVVDLVGGQAYVVVPGFIAYQTRSTNDPLYGKKALRNYGLLLRRLSGQWRVTRAVASTVSLVTVISSSKPDSYENE